MNTCHEPAAELYLATPRQIKDWHNFIHNPSLWISREIRIKTMDPQRVEDAVGKLIRQHDILRTVFVRNDAGTLLRKVLPPDSAAFRVRAYHCRDELEASLTDEAVYRQLMQGKMSDSTAPLFAACTYGQPGAPGRVRLYVHHILCNGSSLQMLVEAFARFYRNPDEAATATYRFQDYARHNIEALMSRFPRDYAFHKKHFDAVDPRIVGPAGGSYLLDAEGFVNALSNAYYHTAEVDPEMRACTTAVAHYSVMPVPGFEQVQRALDARKVFWSGLIFSCFARVMQDLFPGRATLFGFLIDSRYSKYARNMIGEFTGEAFFNTATVGALTPGTLASVQQQVNTLSRHPIFNFNLYSIREGALFGDNCPAFLNFMLPKANLDVSKCTTGGFQKIDFGGVGLQPEVTLYDNGYLATKWRFDLRAHSEAQILEADARWQGYVRACCRALTSGPETHAPAPAGALVAAG